MHPESSGPGGPGRGSTQGRPEARQSQGHSQPAAKPQPGRPRGRRPPEASTGQPGRPEAIPGTAREPGRGSEQGRPGSRGQKIEGIRVAECKHREARPGGEIECAETPRHSTCTRRAAQEGPAIDPRKPRPRQPIKRPTVAVGRHYGPVTPIKRGTDGVVCGRGRNPTLRLWPTIFSGKIDVFPGDRRSRLISSMTSVAPA